MPHRLAAAVANVMPDEFVAWFDEHAGGDGLQRATDAMDNGYAPVKKMKKLIYERGFYSDENESAGDSGPEIVD